MTKTFLPLLALAGSLLLLSGCCAPSYDLHFYASKQFKNEYHVVPAMELDIVAADVRNASQLSIYDLNEYFQVANPMRVAQLHTTVYFSNDNPMPKCISGSHPIWSAAGNMDAKTLFLLVNVPVMTKGSKLKDQDGRRISFTMERSWFGWHSPDKYYIITPTGLKQVDDKPKGDYHEIIIREM